MNASWQNRTTKILQEKSYFSSMKTDKEIFLQMPSSRAWLRTCVCLGWALTPGLATPHEDWVRYYPFSSRVPVTSLVPV